MTPPAILTEKEVLEIRAKYKPKEYSYAKLAKEYNVGSMTVRDVVKRETWFHI